MTETTTSPALISTDYSISTDERGEITQKQIRWVFDDNLGIILKISR